MGWTRASTFDQGTHAKSDRVSVSSMDFDFSTRNTLRIGHSLVSGKLRPGLYVMVPRCDNHHPTDNDNNYNNDQHDHEHAYDPVIGSFLPPLQRRPTLMATHRTRRVECIKWIMLRHEVWTSWKGLSRPCCLPPMTCLSNLRRWHPDRAFTVCGRRRPVGVVVARLKSLVSKL